jgi:SAM-dependent methyltransferase
MSEFEWTGERYLPRISGEIELEHYHRYLLARKLAVNKAVLDIACGEGYGSNLLADVAASITGVDISGDAISHAKSSYHKDNVKFLQGSCADIPVPDNSVDMVVSFETIEHHDQHEEMMLEIKRVLKADGMLVISSPDKKEYSDIPGYKNEFHVKELYLSEFDQLLRSCFKKVIMFGQRVKCGSLIVPINKNQSSPIIVFDKGKGNSEEFDPLYFIAVASDRKAIPELSSFYGIPPETLYDARLADLRKQLEAEKRNGEEQVSYRDDLVEELKQQLESERKNSEKQILYRDDLVEELKQQLESERETAEVQIASRDALVMKLQEQLSSPIWKLVSERISKASFGRVGRWIRKNDIKVLK